MSRMMYFFVEFVLIPSEKMCLLLRAAKCICLVLSVIIMSMISGHTVTVTVNQSDS